MIDRLNPSDDVLDARSIGFAEGQQSRDEEVEALTAERDALVNSHHNLLEACKAALWYYDAFRDKSPVGDTERDDIEAVRAAIAKAEGRD